MPKRRVIGKARRRVTIADLSLSEVFTLQVGWKPPTREFERSQARWHTWAELFEEYEQIRAGFLLDEFSQATYEMGETPWVEVAYQDWLAQGRPALDTI